MLHISRGMGHTLGLYQFSSVNEPNITLKTAVKFRFLGMQLLGSTHIFVAIKSNILSTPLVFMSNIPVTACFSYQNGNDGSKLRMTWQELKYSSNEVTFSDHLG